MRCVTYKCVLIFIIIKYVKSQDNNPDQPADDEEDEDNFEVLDLEQIIQERISRFEDPRYQPQYQQIQESQYPPQPQTQPQQYPGYQPESFQYQPIPETQYHQQLQPQTQQYDQYQPYVTLPQVTQPQTQEQEQPSQSSQYQYYLPQSQDSYGYQQPYGTQSLYDIGHQLITEIQPQVTQLQQPEQFYETTTQPTQPIGTTEESYQYYEHTHAIPPIPPTQPQPQPQVDKQPVDYYLPPSTQPQQVTQQQYYQHYEPTAPSTQPSYQYYQPYVQPQTLEDDENFYVTEHDQVHQVPSTTDPEFTYGQTQPTPIPPTQHVPPTTQEHVAEEPKQPRKRKKTQDSGDQSDEEGGDEKPVKLKKPRPIKKTKHIKFYKINYLGNLEEMTDEDYVVKHNDEDKAIYDFISNLEQIQSDGEIIFEHLYGTPYCLSLTHSKRTNVIIITNIQGFILIKKTEGLWERTDAPIPDYVNIYTQDLEGNDVLLTSNDYDITLTSAGSFRYVLLPGVKCTKIIVNGLLTWKKTDDDDGSPLLIYVTPKLRVIIDFEGYCRVLGIRRNKYRLVCTKKISKGSKYH